MWVASRVVHECSDLLLQSWNIYIQGRAVWSLLWFESKKSAGSNVTNLRQFDSLTVRATVQNIISLKDYFIKGLKESVREKRNMDEVRWRTQRTVQSTSKRNSQWQQPIERSRNKTSTATNAFPLPQNYFHHSIHLLLSSNPNPPPSNLLNSALPSSNLNLLSWFWIEPYKEGVHSQRNKSGKLAYSDLTIIPASTVEKWVTESKIITDSSNRLQAWI